MRHINLKFLIIAALISGTAQAADSIVILPRQITLNGTAARQQLVVEKTNGRDFLGPADGEIEFESSDLKIVEVKDGAALPVGNGRATITAKLGKSIAAVSVNVSGMDQPFEWSFRNNVQPVLAKMGCSSGACHGAAAGKNGFRLSLRGYDDDGDYRSIMKQSFGRRVVLSDPGRSLLLTKPTMAIPHKGGHRFDVDSLEYRVLSEWIASGAPEPNPSEPRISRIEVLPEHVVLKPGVEQPVLVRAHFDNGQTEDVTRWVKFTSSNQSVATVDDHGKVKVVGCGEGAITAWYLSRIAIAIVTSPYEKPVAPAAFANAPKRNFIDEIVLEKLRELNLPPSRKSDDSEFVRRAFVDTIGVLPTADEVRVFLADRSKNKRDALIEKLIERPEFVDYWAYKWSDLLLVNTEKLSAPAMWSFYNWIRDNVAANAPWDKFVRAIVTSKGSTLENGAANYYALHDDATIMAETTSQAFLGLSVTCAKCHNHPMEKWTNDQYFEYANLFARVRVKNGSGEGNRIIFVVSEGDVIQPLTGKARAPRPLDGTAISIDSPNDRREHLANWLVSRSNPYFSRAISNRVWASFFGTGLVEAVDDLRVTNPASNEKLLSAVAAHLADNQFDLKKLMRTILQSETYQRSSEALSENAADLRFYARYYPRRMKAEVLLDALSQVSGEPTKFSGYPDGYRALQLPDSNVASYFLKSFGRPNRLITCDCERTDEPSMAQVLHIANGDTINSKLAAKGNRIDKFVHEKTPDDKIIEEIYLSALARYPNDAERAKIAKVLAEAGSDRRHAIEDMCWGVLSSKEFLFNH